VNMKDIGTAILKRKPTNIYNSWSK